MQAVFKQAYEAFALALPRGINADRYLRIAFNIYKKSPRLQEAHPMTYVSAVMDGAQLGIELDPLLKEGFIAKYGKACRFQTMYLGSLKLARNADTVATVDADIVYERDKLVWRKGSEPCFIHEPHLLGDRGDAVRAYAIARFKSGGYQEVCWTVPEIEEKIRDRYARGYWDSMAAIDQAVVEIMARKDNALDHEAARNLAIDSLTRDGKLSVWLTNPEAMWKKSMVIQLCKLLPLTAESRRQFTREEMMERGEQIPDDQTEKPLLPVVVGAEKFESDVEPEPAQQGAEESPTSKLAADMKAKREEKGETKQ